MMKTKLIGILVLLVLFTAGCNTVSGAGKDIKAVGDTVEDVAEKTKDNLKKD